MKSQVLSQFPMIGLTCAGLLIFVLYFLGVVFWAYRKSNRSIYKKLSELPLQEDLR
jgi:cbb3-type cytochrome oxidase subunit 3